MSLIQHFNAGVAVDRSKKEGVLCEREIILRLADIVLRVVFVGTFFGTSYYLLSVNNNCVKSHKNLREYLCEKV